MLVAPQLPIQTTKMFLIFLDFYLCPPTLKNVPPPMVTIHVITNKYLQ